MKKFITAALLLTISISAFCGTIIYRNSQKEKKIISEIDIVSIDKNIITFKIGKTTRTLPFSSMLKYYDTDINMNLAFDDNTSDYDIYVTNVKLPPNNRGITTRNSGKKGKKQVNKITLDYAVSMKNQKNQRRAIKAPYFYLYILTSSQNHSGTSLYCFSYPEVAKIRNTKNYNEAAMLERVLSSDRPNYNSEFIMYGKGMNGVRRSATFELNGIGNREIIAYHLVAWAKDDIAFTENKIVNRRYNISKNWHIHAKNQK